MKIRTSLQSDWERFDTLSQNESWRVPALERKLFLSAWRHDAGALIKDELFCGLVTAVAHDKSGWIGNLIVPVELRGQGYGGFLFRWAVKKLLRDHVTSIWLTASEQGRPIYEREGFEIVDRIERWVLQPRQGVWTDVTAGRESWTYLSNFDQQVWGESRSVLLNTLQKNNQSFCCDDSVALLQCDNEMQIIGPWYSKDPCSRSNRKLLQQLIAVANPSVEIVVDLLASSPIRSLLAAAGFQPAGETALMASGESSQVDFKKMIALASLGSVG